MNFKKARAIRRKVSWLVKGKLSEFVKNDRLCEGEVVSFKDEPNFHSHWTESTVVEEVLLYWVRDCTADGPTAMIAGYECGKGGVGRCLFSAWTVTDGDIWEIRWDIKCSDCCPPALARELEDLIWSLHEEEDC